MLEKHTCRWLAIFLFKKKVYCLFYLYKNWTKIYYMKVTNILFLAFQMLSCKDKITAQVKPVSFTINDQTYTGKGPSINDVTQFLTFFWPPSPYRYAFYYWGPSTVVIKSWPPIPKDRDVINGRPPNELYYTKLKGFIFDIRLVSLITSFVSKIDSCQITCISDIGPKAVTRRSMIMRMVFLSNVSMPFTLRTAIFWVH